MQGYFFPAETIQEQFPHVYYFWRTQIRNDAFDSNKMWTRYEGMMHHENLQYDFMPEKSDVWREEIEPSLLRRVEVQAREALDAFGYEIGSSAGVTIPLLSKQKVNPHPEKKRAICVLGMHRSGTSAITRALNLLGLHIGNPEHLMKPVEGDNPHGFWEQLSIFSLHERLLSFLSRSWDNILPPREGWWKEPEISPYRDELKTIIQGEFGGQQLWLWKDPRTSLLLPLWKEVMQELDIEVSYLICVRNPLDVAASLKRRNDFSKGKSLALWQLYNLSALLWTNGANRMAVHFDDFIEEWETSLKRVSSSLHLPWPEDEEELRKYMAGFLRPGDRHSCSETELLLRDKDAAQPVVRLYQLLVEAIREDDMVYTGRFLGEVETLYREYCDYAGIFSSNSGDGGPLVSVGQDGRIDDEDKAAAEGSPSETKTGAGRRRGFPGRGGIERLVFPKFSSPTASIIIPVWNQWEYTRRCLKTILANTHEIPYEVIVIDNGSTDRTEELLSGAENITVIRNSSNAGYLLACNQGAAAAKGEHLVLLNNDTEPLPGWLKELVGTADADPKAGAVGGKLIYPDGRLQEAGGMVFSDGRSWNFGNGDDPNEEIYNVMCEVDYCSGACLLVRRHLFEALGGFAIRYVPAYYEDTDLCFGLRKMGYKVLYNPDVCVVHHESVTAGTDESQGFRRYVEINRKKFIEKWADELSLQDASPWEGRVPVTACRERLLRDDLTQEDVIYCLNGGKTARRRHPSSLPIDKSVVYKTIAEKEKKSADVVLSAVSRYGPDKIGVAWSGGKDSAALIHVIRQACGGVIPVKVISLLTGEDSPEEHRFVEGLSREWGFDLLTPDAGLSSGVRNGHDSHPEPSLEALFRTAVQRLHLKALITGGRRGDGPEPPSVYFCHEDNPRYVRVQPMLHFREVDVWQYIKKYDVPLCGMIHGGDRDSLCGVRNDGGD